MAEKDTFAYALSSNNAWASYKAHGNADFFPRLAKGQSPKMLWIGCSDSRCPEATLLGMQPGDIFAHRNIANVVSPTDINLCAVLEYAVDHLKVNYIVLCGHSDCGGAKAALGNARVGGVLDTWLTPLKAVRRAHAEELDAITDDAARAVRIAELNVEAGVQVLLANTSVQEAVAKRGLEVHGCLFNLASGRITDLGYGTSKRRGSAGGAGARAGADDVVRGRHAMLVFRGANASMTAL